MVSPSTHRKPLPVAHYQTVMPQSFLAQFGNDHCTVTDCIDPALTYNSDPQHGTSSRDAGAIAVAAEVDERSALIMDPQAPASIFQTPQFSNPPEVWPTSITPSTDPAISLLPSDYQIAADPFQYLQSEPDYHAGALAGIPGTTLLAGSGGEGGMLRDPNMIQGCETTSNSVLEPMTPPVHEMQPVWGAMGVEPTGLTPFESPFDYSFEFSKPDVALDLFGIGSTLMSPAQPSLDALLSTYTPWADHQASPQPPVDLQPAIPSACLPLWPDEEERPTFRDDRVTPGEGDLLHAFEPARLDVNGPEGCVPARRQMGTRDSPRNTSKDEMLVRCRQQGMSYKQIKYLGGFSEAESTLRGRYRALTKPKEARLRKPSWGPWEIKLLLEAISRCSKAHPPDLRFPGETDAVAVSLFVNKVPWKQVAEYMERRGAYRYGNATVKKKYLEILRASRSTAPPPTYSQCGHAHGSTQDLP